MHRVIVFCSLLVSSSNTLPARTPKIYNALITSDENLSPSRAYPVLEPVIRTSAVGVALPPLIVNPVASVIFSSNGLKNNIGETSNETPANVQSQPLQQQAQFFHYGSLYPVSYEPYYHQEYLYPLMQQNHQYPIVENKRPPIQESESPRIPALPQIAVNFKKNPEIPDVIPALPIKTNFKEKI